MLLQLICFCAVVMLVLAAIAVPLLSNCHRECCVCVPVLRPVAADNSAIAWNFFEFAGLFINSPHCIVVLLLRLPAYLRLL